MSVGVDGPSGTAIAARATVATRATVARLDVDRLLFYASIVMSGVSTATVMAGFACGTDAGKAHGSYKTNA